MTPTPPSVNGTSTASPPSSSQIPSPSPAPASNSLTLEGTAKTIAGVGSLLYILGLLVVNVYLGQWYIIDYSLLSARVIAAGVIFVVFTIIIALLPLIATLYLFEMMRSSVSKILPSWLSKHPRARIVLHVIFGVLVSSALIYMVYHVFGWLVRSVEFSRQIRPPHTADRSVANEAFLIYLFAFFTAVCVLEAITTSWTRHWRVLGRLSLYAFVLLAYIAFFARGVYAGLPFDVGGASPRQTQFLVAADEVANVTQLGIPFEANSNLSKPVVVLFEATAVYLVRLDNGDVVQINKDLVQGGRLRKAAPTMTP